MSKRNKNKNVNAESNDVVEIIENKEETEMTEKKGIIESIKEFGNKVPKPVKMIAGGVAAAAAIGGAALVVISKVRNGEDADFDEITDFEDSDIETVAAEAETPVED